MEPKSESIGSLVQSVNSKNTVLPEFQRDFVWDIERTYELFDSLIRNIFIGSIIYGKPSFDVTIREIDKRPRRGKDSRKKLEKSYLSAKDVREKAHTQNFRLILDGQQRVTALVRAFYGYDNVYFVCKNNANQAKHTELENIMQCISGQEDNTRISVNLKDVWKMHYGTINREAQKEELLKKSKLCNGREPSDKELEIYLTVTEKLVELLRKEKLVSFYVFDMDTEQFTLFFERSNSTGVNLNFVDILVAKLYSGFNLREAIENFEANPDHKTLNRETIIRSISIFVSNYQNISKSYILKELKPDHFSSKWEEVCDYYSKSIDFLFENHYIISQAWMPYPNMLIPIIVFLAELNGDFSRLNDRQNNFFKLWYWLSVFSQSFTGSSNEIIIQNSKNLTRIAQNKKLEDNEFHKSLKVQIATIKYQVLSKDSLFSFNKKTSGIYKGLLNFIHFIGDGLKDWKNNNTLSLNSNLEDHHIFPKKYLQDKFGGNEDIQSVKDSVPNRTLIPKLDNIKIGKRPPSEYMKDILKANSKLSDTIKTHLIQPNILSDISDKKPLEFMEERQTKIQKKNSNDNHR